MGRSVRILNSVAREAQTSENVNYEYRHERNEDINPEKLWERTFPDGGNRMCKGSEVTACWTW